jgi:uncharacterized protein HemX
MDMKSGKSSKGALMSGVKVALAVAGGILLAAFIQKQMAAKATEDAE